MEEGALITATGLRHRPVHRWRALVLAEIERRLGIAERLARWIADPRAPERVSTVSPR